MNQPGLLALESCRGFIIARGALFNEVVEATCCFKFIADDVGEALWGGLDDVACDPARIDCHLESIGDWRERASARSFIAITVIGILLDCHADGVDSNVVESRLEQCQCICERQSTWANRA